MKQENYPKMKNYPMTRERWRELREILDRVALFYKEPVTKLITHGLATGKYSVSDYAKILGTSRQNIQQVYDIFPSRIKRTGEKEK